eukprot:jgi/Bigna1/131202/aug1.13_g5910
MMEDVLEQFGDLDVRDGRRVAKHVLHCDGIDENVDDLVKTMTNDLESREFALHRCMDEGATLRTWACMLKKSGDPDHAPPGTLETKERKAKQQPSVRDVAGAIDSFQEKERRNNIQGNQHTHVAPGAGLQQLGLRPLLLAAAAASSIVMFTVSSSISTSHQLCKEIIVA